MDPRESRFWIRIESGPLRGREVAVPAGGISIGRRPGNGLVLEDASVSGHHAEIRAEGEAKGKEGGLVLVDLGSTNGTRVGGERVERHALAHGDRFHLGAVELAFLDAALASAPLPAGEEIGAIAAERVRAAGGRRGIRGAFLLLAVVAAGAVAAWRLRGEGGEGPAAAARVSEAPGNLLADGTFEGTAGADAWEVAETAPQGFFRDAAFAATGSAGFGASLQAGEWALALSPPLAVGSRAAHLLRASLRVEGEARARIGLRFASSAGDGPEFDVWSRVAPASDEIASLALPFLGLPGYDRVRVLVAAAAPGPGSVGVDDVELVPGEAAAELAVRGADAEARLFGSDATTAALVRSGRVLLPGIELAPEIAAAGAGSWTAAVAGKGLDFTAAGAPPEGILEIALAVAGPEDAARAGFLAARGPDGYRSLGTEFDLPAATDLLAGRGVDLVRLSFGRPVAIAGSVREGALRLRVVRAGLDSFHVQLSFAAERTRARDLAARAQEAEARGRFGEALAAWSTLLDEVPFDAPLVSQTEAARVRLVQDGLARLGAIRAEVERARFFALAELFRQCRARAVAVAGTFAPGPDGAAGGPSEIAEEAAALVAEIDAALAGLGRDEAGEGRARLRAVLAAIDAATAPDLTAHVRESLGAGAEEDRSE
ncbi:MAG: FHA domain-containing protein [Planctomycetota bacterium]